jgi:vitamin B12 transporter
MVLRRAWIGASALVFTSLSAHAQEAAVLAPVQVTGLRPAELGEVTASVSVLTADDLAVRRAPNPADQLRAVAGASVSRSGSLGGLTQVRLRGAEANHTLVLLDGVELSDPVTGETDFGLLTALPIGRIEVLRGEGSSVYGSDAIGGVVLLTSAQGAGWTGFAEGGSFGTGQGAVGWSGDHLGLAASGFETGGVDSSGTGGRKDGSLAFSGLASARYDFGADWALSLAGLLRRTESDFDADTDFDGRLDDAALQTMSEQALAGGTLTGTTGPVDHVLSGSFNTLERKTTDTGVFTDRATGERTKFSWSPAVAIGAQSFAGLIDFERETYERRDASFGGLTNASEAFESVGIAGEYRAARAGFDVSVLARFDDNRGRFDDAATWRAGAAYAFDATRGRLRASIGTGVKNPTFTELFGFFPGSFIGNPDLEPETSLGWELGWAQSLGALTLDAAYFEANLENEIFTAFNPNFTSTSRNRVGESDRSGVELSAKWQAAPRLSLSGQATFLSSRNDAGEDEIRVPQRTASLAADWHDPGKGIRLGAALDYVGDQGDLDFGAFPAARVDLDAYVLASLTAEIPLTEDIALTLRGDNLLDKTATDVLGYSGPGAGLYVGLKLR